MDGLLTSEALCDEGLNTKTKKKPLSQKLRSRCIHLLHNLWPEKHPTRYQDLRGVGTRARLNDGKKTKERMPSVLKENRWEHPNAEQSQAHFHFAHRKIRLHFHSPCCLNSNLDPHLSFRKNLTKHKGDLQSNNLPKDVPKGFLAVYVGQEHQRFVIPVFYLNHPLFEELLKGMEEEFGFQQRGALLLPCEVSDFEVLRSRIGRHNSSKIRNRSG